MRHELLLILAFVSPLAAQPVVSPTSADKDFCAYLKDVEAQPDSACASDVIAALKSADIGAYSQKVELARKRKTDVLKAYEILKTSPIADKGQGVLQSLLPPINERTFPAWVGSGSKAVYAAWLQGQNRRLQEEKTNPVSPERRKEIDAVMSANQGRIAGLGKLTDAATLNCAIGESCGARSALVDPAGIGGPPVKGSWTAADYARANAQPNAQRFSTGGSLDRGIPALSPIVSEVVSNSPLAPLAENHPNKNPLPYQTAAELALAATGGLLLFGGMGGKALEEKFPNIRRNMGIAAGVSGAVALGAISLAPLSPAAAAVPIVETTVESANPLAHALAGGGSLAGADASMSFFQAALKTAGIGASVLVLKDGLKHLLFPGIPPYSQASPGIREPIFAKPPHDARNPTGAKAPGKPGKNEGFTDPAAGENWGRTTHGDRGWIDENGDVWVPSGQGRQAHGGPHWDVQSPDGRNHRNVYPGGRIR